VAILTGVGDAFCAGADLATYVPINYVDAPSSRVREIVDLGLGASPVGCIGSPSRRSPLSTCGPWRVGLSSRWPAICEWLLTVRCSDRSRRGAASITAMAESPGWSTHVALAWQCKWSLPPSRLTPIERCNATWWRKLFRTNGLWARPSSWLDRSCATLSGRFAPLKRPSSTSSASRWVIS